MKVIIREGSAAKDYELLKDLIGESPNMVMLCTDDCHPDDLVRGHINQIVKRALADGYDLWSVLQVACVNAQRHYRQKWGLLQAGDPATFIVVDNLSSHFRVQHTFIRGTEVFSYNGNISHNAIFIGSEGEMEMPNRFEAEPITVEDLNMDMKTGDTVHVILASDGSLLTKHEVEKLTGNPLKDARYPWSEVQKMVVYNRYEPGAKPIVGLVRGFGIQWSGNRHPHNQHARDRKADGLSDEVAFHHNGLYVSASYPRHQADRPPSDGHEDNERDLLIPRPQRGTCVPPI